jgi:two-component sensor histidine kinase
MLTRLATFFKKIEIWEMVLISILLSEIFTAGMNTAVSFFYWRNVNRDLLLIGSIDALFVAMAVSFIIMTIVVEIRKIEKRSEEVIKSSLEEKETLLRELNHRTKNNMQIISSLLQIQSASIEDEKMQQVFTDTQNRIAAMALVHEKLYKAENLSRIKLKDYISDLAQALLKGWQKKPGLISLKLDIEDISLPIDSITPCGLIVNELMSNSLKHAFPGDRPGEIRISFHEIPDNRIEFSFSDNGIGLLEDFNDKKSLGLRLVRSMAIKQLEGMLEINSDGGAEFKIIFKKG